MSKAKASVTDRENFTGDILGTHNVTNSKKETGDTFDNRNGGVRTLEELVPLIKEQIALGDEAAEIGALFAAADPRTDEQKRLGRIVHESVKTATGMRQV